MICSCRRIGSWHWRRGQSR